MTELQAAVGIAQLAKARKLVDARIRAARLLLQMLEDLQGIRLPVDLGWTKHTYHLFALGVEPKTFRVGTEALCTALQAEGLIAHAGYLPQPLYMYPVIRDMQTYGSTGCPFSCPHSTAHRTLRVLQCPNAERVCRETIVLPWNEFYTEAHLEQISDAIHKVLTFYQS
jgi:dTDP-4-amino-4,6-dideoxygalactose transaminase